SIPFQSKPCYYFLLQLDATRYYPPTLLTLERVIMQSLWKNREHNSKINGVSFYSPYCNIQGSGSNVLLCPLDHRAIYKHSHTNM
uniref:Uncharacterized protein n=1 Tax=Podarcis muralis TaxID=64176 RepID=A0A670JE89_PODMU